MAKSTTAIVIVVTTTTSQYIADFLDEFWDRTGSN